MFISKEEKDHQEFTAVLDELIFNSISDGKSNAMIVALLVDRAVKLGFHSTSARNVLIHVLQVITENLMDERNFDSNFEEDCEAECLDHPAITHIH